MSTSTSDAAPEAATDAASDPKTAPLRSLCTDNFAPLLEELGASVFITTYQAGKLVVLRPRGQTLNTHFRSFNSPMGMALQGDRLSIGTPGFVSEFRNVPAVGQRQEPLGEIDACFLPRATHVSGNVQVHEMAYDADGVLWDIYDAARLLRHIAWQEPVPTNPPLDRDGDGRVGEADLRSLLQLMLTHLDRGEAVVDRLSSVRVSNDEVRAVFVDGTELVVPRAWQGLVADLQLGDGVSSALLSVRKRVAELPSPLLPLAERCLAPGEVTINTPFYRVQPHEMRRYSALAVDNIRRDPMAYALSVAYRSVRLFVIMGSDDQGTAHQFENSRLVYLAGTAASGGFFLLFLAGAWIGWRRGYAVGLSLFVIATLPASIAFVLINMRYTITVQPLVLMFAAVSLLALWDRVRRGGARVPAP